MRIPLGSIVTACALSVAVLVAGCARPGVKEARMGEDVYLLPAAVQGPDPFTGSTVTAAGAPRAPGTGGADPAAPPHTGAADATPTGPPATGPSPPALPAALVGVPLGAMRVLSGATPGLYGGTARVAGCDIERQIGYLAADRARGEAFARASGVLASGLARYLRGLAPVVLRADTRVTGRGYRDGQAVGYQAVLQAGTAVLVDNRGVPRVRCACGNPLASPAPTHGGFGVRGSAWPGYRPGQVIAVTPAPRAVTSLTIFNVETHTWIERRIGHDVRTDQVVPAPAWATAAPDVSATPGTAPPSSSRPSPQPSRPGASTGTTGTPPTVATPASPDRSAGSAAPVPRTAGPRTSPSLDLTSDVPGLPDPPDGIGPPGVPDTTGLQDGIGPPGGPDTTALPDGGGTVTYGTAGSRTAGSGTKGDGLLDVPADPPGR
ncbi:DUF6777 domain-containing protein [Streptomyces sp. NPDC046759]|uniref:DUF6777 domain-containing protein n=1 Tax=Streptomyces sp. NPDC046759 TaxID=3155019 RepID=UPI0033CFEB19